MNPIKAVKTKEAANTLITLIRWFCIDSGLMRASITFVENKDNINVTTNKITPSVNVKTVVFL